MVRIKTRTLLGGRKGERVSFGLVWGRVGGGGLRR